jgi:hypothetical protein
MKQSKWALLAHTVATMASHHIIATLTFDIIVALVTLLTSLPVTWHEEHHWNFSVLQTVHNSNLVIL